MLRLRPMTQERLEAYLVMSVPSFAADKVKAGDWPEETAVETSQAAFAKFLPAGLASPGQLLFDVVEESTGASIGSLWLSVDDKAREIFIYDILIDEPHRGRGLGTQTLKLAEEEARRHGCTKLSLHVFGHNERALALYRKMGYGMVDTLMRKHLS